jgi:DNA-binding response OmpR family regulator
VGSIAEFERAFVPAHHTIAIVDLGLPDGDGMNLIARLRRDNLRLGIIVLTARIGLRDKVAGLQNGADHYLAKTADLDELAAIVDALARRLNLGGVSGDWALDCTQRRLIPPGLPPIELSAQDFTVLKTIVDGEGHPVSKKD